MEDRAKLEELKDILYRLEKSIENCGKNQYIDWGSVLDDISFTITK